MRDLLDDDPMPTTPPRPGFQYARNEFGWCQERVPTKSGQTPHAKLRHKCRDALTAWRQRVGCSVVLLPSIVGKMRVGGRNGKDIGVGIKGQADDTILVLGTALACEYKAGHDRQSEVQQRFQQRWEAAGGVYIICRAPTDLTDALDQIASQRGKIF